MPSTSILTIFQRLDSWQFFAFKKQQTRFNLGFAYCRVLPRVMPKTHPRRHMRCLCFGYIHPPPVCIVSCNHTCLFLRCCWTSAASTTGTAASTTGSATSTTGTGAATGDGANFMMGSSGAGQTSTVGVACSSSFCSAFKPVAAVSVTFRPPNLQKIWLTKQTKASEQCCKKRERDWTTRAII